MLYFVIIILLFRNASQATSIRDLQWYSIDTVKHLVSITIILIDKEIQGGNSDRDSEKRKEKDDEKQRKGSDEKQEGNDEKQKKARDKMEIDEKQKAMI